MRVLSVFVFLVCLMTASASGQESSQVFRFANNLHAKYGIRAEIAETALQMQHTAYPSRDALERAQIDLYETSIILENLNLTEQFLLNRMRANVHLANDEFHEAKRLLEENSNNTGVTDRNKQGSFNRLMTAAFATSDFPLAIKSYHASNSKPTQEDPFKSLMLIEIMTRSGEYSAARDFLDTLFTSMKQYKCSPPSSLEKLKQALDENDLSYLDAFKATTKPQLFMPSSIKRSKISRLVPPKYPAMARRAGISGWVKVKYLVEKDGTVSCALPVSWSHKKYFPMNAAKSVKKYRVEILDPNWNWPITDEIIVRFKQ